MNTLGPYIKSIYSNNFQDERDYDYIRHCLFNKHMFMVYKESRYDIWYNSRYIKKYESSKEAMNDLDISLIASGFILIDDNDKFEKIKLII